MPIYYQEIKEPIKSISLDQKNEIENRKQIYQNMMNETLVMTLDVLANQSITITKLSDGYCLEECPQDEKKIADIWYDVG